MLSLRGLCCLAAAIALPVAGWAIGAPELSVFGISIAVVLVLAVIAARVAPTPRLEVTRTLHPPRVHAGNPCRVRIRLRNAGQRRSPAMQVNDRVVGVGKAGALIPSLAAGEEAGGAYRIPTSRRGRLAIGPITVSRGDPFNLAKSNRSVPGTVELIVYPAIEAIVPLPQTTGDDPSGGADHRRSVGTAGDDFFGLRRYVVGDDLRRVHWPSTARHDELVVRQVELAWQGRTTVLLDVREGQHTTQSLELAISAAASVIAAGDRRQDLVRLVTTSGTDSGFAAGHAHVEALLEHLACLEATPGAGPIDGVLGHLAASSSGGALIAVGALLPAGEVGQLTRLRERFGSVGIVRFEPSSWGSDRPAPPVPADPGLVSVTAERSFTAAWTDLVARHTHLHPQVRR